MAYRGLNKSTKLGVHTRGEEAAEAEIAQKHCKGCLANMGAEKNGFPICNDGAPIQQMVPAGTVTTDEIRSHYKCRRFL